MLPAVAEPAEEPVERVPAREEPEHRRAAGPQRVPGGQLLVEGALKALAKVSRMLRDRLLCQKVRGSTSCDAIYTLINETEGRNAA